jgi:hypothetical protein
MLSKIAAHALPALLVLVLAPPAPAAPLGALRFAGAATVPNDKQVDGTLVGGLSGIDFDPASGLFWAISDDRSENAPARLYTVRLNFSADRLFTAEVLKAVTLLQADGAPYPRAAMGGEVPDPEALRLDPINANVVWWTSEGDRGRNLKPFVRAVDRGGKYVAALPIPDMFTPFADREVGVRNNLAFESLTFSADGATLWVGMETARYEDGPVASPTAGSVARFTNFARDGRVFGQFVYPVDAIPARPGAGKNADNGVTEILAIDERRMLVIERAGVQGDDNRYVNYIRIYEADLEGATNVAAMPSLVGATYRPMTKRLVLDLAKSPIGYVDNIEGVTFGPRLSNGNRTLILVSDNNFNAAQITQFLAFEILP